MQHNGLRQFHGLVNPALEAQKAILDALPKFLSELICMHVPKERRGAQWVELVAFLTRETDNYFNNGGAPEKTALMAHLTRLLVERLQQQATTNAVAMGVQATKVDVSNSLQ